MTDPFMPRANLIDMSPTACRIIEKFYQFKPERLIYNNAANQTLYVMGSVINLCNEGLIQ